MMDIKTSQSPKLTHRNRRLLHENQHSDLFDFSWWRCASHERLSMHTVWLLTYTDPFTPTQTPRETPPTPKESIYNLMNQLVLF